MGRFGLLPTRPISFRGAFSSFLFQSAVLNSAKAPLESVLICVIWKPKIIIRSIKL